MSDNKFCPIDLMTKISSNDGVFRTIVVGALTSMVGLLAAIFIFLVFNL